MEEVNLIKIAQTTKEDFYELLSVSSTASITEIRSAYRRTALKFHPDKNADNKKAVDKFHLLTLGLNLLEDEKARQVYDKARHAREQKVHRENLLSERRRQLVADLERREKLSMLSKRNGSKSTVVSTGNDPGIPSNNSGASLPVYRRKWSKGVDSSTSGASMLDLQRKDYEETKILLANEIKKLAEDGKRRRLELHERRLKRRAEAIQRSS